jgi:hypothetical protein
MRLSLVAWRTVPDPTTWIAVGPPRGQKRQYTPGYQQWAWTPMGKCRTPLCMDRTPGKVQNHHKRAKTPGPPPRTPPPPPGRVWATRSKVPRFWRKGYPGLDQGQVGVRNQHVFGPCRVSSCSPLRRRPDAATRPTARDVSQRTEPDVWPLGHAASAFITDRTRCLTGDVLPQHLMCPVHSAGRRRAGHPAGGMPIQSIVKQYTRAASCTVSIITYTLPGKLLLHANTTQNTDVRAQEDCSNNEH